MKTGLDSQLSAIPVPESLHDRCAIGAHAAAQARRRTTLKRLTAAAAAVCVLTLSHPSVADGLRGFFSDITRSDGAVTGTAYTPGEGEILLSVGGSLLEIRFIFREEFPCRELERLALEARILGADGSETAFSGEAEVIGGTAALPLPGLPAGEYTLKIDSLSGLSKADSPLEIRGEWEIGFISE